MRPLPCSHAMPSQSHEGQLPPGCDQPSRTARIHPHPQPELPLLACFWLPVTPAASNMGKAQPELAKGVPALGASKTYKRRGLWNIKKKNGEAQRPAPRGVHDRQP